METYNNIVVELRLFSGDRCLISGVWRSDTHSPKVERFCTGDVLPKVGNQNVGWYLVRPE